MSYDDGWAAMNLEMPKRIPRTEYSAPRHRDLITAVTGINVGANSSDELQHKASLTFMKAWNYSFFWSTLVYYEALGDYQSDMGHAEYAANGVDRQDTILICTMTPKTCSTLTPGKSWASGINRSLFTV